MEPTDVQVRRGSAASFVIGISMSLVSLAVAAYSFRLATLVRIEAARERIVVINGQRMLVTFEILPATGGGKANASLPDCPVPSIEQFGFDSGDGRRSRLATAQLNALTVSAEISASNAISICDGLASLSAPGLMVEPVEPLALHLRPASHHSLRWVVFPQQAGRYIALLTVQSGRGQSSEMKALLDVENEFGVSANAGKRWGRVTGFGATALALLVAGLGVITVPFWHPSFAQGARERPPRRKSDKA